MITDSEFEDIKARMRKLEFTVTKTLIVLEALWSNQNHPEATKIIEEFREATRK